MLSVTQSYNQSDIHLSPTQMPFQHQYMQEYAIMFFIHDNPVIIKKKRKSKKKILTSIPNKFKQK